MTETTQVLDLNLTQLPAEIVTHAQTLIGIAQRAVISNDKDLADSGSVVAQINSHLDQVDAAKDRIAKPLNAAKAALMKEWHASRDPLAEAKQKIISKQNKYNLDRRLAREAEEMRLREEQERLALEEAQRLQDAAMLEAQRLQEEGKAIEAAQIIRDADHRAADVLEEAAAAPIAAPPPPPAVARGAYGGVGFRTVWKAEILDLATVLTIPIIRDNEKVREAVQKVLDAQVRGGTRALAGVRIYSVEEANNRR